MRGATGFSRSSGSPERMILTRPTSGADPTASVEETRPASQSNGRTAGARRAPDGDGKRAEASARSVLGMQLSASLRESLIEQLAAINSADEVAAWAHRNMPAKNRLAAADAKMVEGRFQARLVQIEQQETDESSRALATSARTPDGSAPNDLAHDFPKQSHASAGVAVAPTTQKTGAMGRKRSASSSVQALGKPVRLRDKDHRRFVLREACLVCGRVPSDPHHLTFTQPRALGRRVSDEFTVPVCRLHHRELHRSGNEAAWWQRLNIDPIPVALELWQRSRRGEVVPPRATQAQPVKTPDVSPQGRADTNHGSGPNAQQTQNSSPEG